MSKEIKVKNLDPGYYIGMDSKKSLLCVVNCEWSCEDEPAIYVERYYNPGCKNKYEALTKDVVNNFRFCPYCGSEIEVIYNV